MTHKLLTDYYLFQYHSTMDHWRGRVAFVTGASAGIGKVIAIELVKHGLKAVGFARRKEALEEIAKEQSSAKGKFYSYAGDAAKEEDLLKALQWTKDNVGPVSILINNAAVLNLSKLTEFDTKALEQIYDINVLAPCITTREAIKHMKESNIDGHIININSVAGHKIVPVGNLALYTSTKHALTALTENLRLELALEKSKIKVTSISPGTVKTDMLNIAIDNLKLPSDSTIQMKYLQPDDVANAVVYVLATPPTVNITELTIQPVGEEV